MLQKLKNTLKEQKGFTLVELLAVIVILGIIAAIAVPSIGNIIDNSRKDAAISDALQVINAAKLAQAAGEGSGTWEDGDLEEYLTNNSAFHNVTYDETNREYSITGHEGLRTEFDVKTTDADYTVTEQQLLDGRDEIPSS